jgi:putative membrane protein
MLAAAVAATKRIVLDRLTAVATSGRRQFALRPGEWVMLASFGVYSFVFPFAIVLLSLDLMPFGMEWMSSLLLAMLGVAAWSWLWVNFGPAGLALGGVVLVAGLALEYVGVTTGVPFGSYSYTGVLVPGLPGGVPLAIGFAWLLVIVGGLFTARRLLTGRAKGWPTWLLGAILAVGLDLLLEPVAYHVKGYWLWAANQGGYYGVPWSNFAAWFVAALAMSALTGVLLRRGNQLTWAWLPVALYAMNLVMFGLVNLAHGFWLAALVGAVLLALVTFRVARPGGTKTVI